MPTKEKEPQPTDRYVDRPFNIRPLCFWALVVGITIALCRWSPWAVLAWLLMLGGLLFACQFARTNDAVLKFLGTSRVFFAGAIALCLAVTLSFDITTLTYTNQQSFGGNAQLSGVIETHKFRPTDNGASYIVLSNAKFDGKNLSGRVIVFINKYDETANPVSGDKVTFRTSLQKSNPDERNINTRVKYTGSADFADISVTGKAKDLRQNVTRYSKNFLHKYLGADNAELMFSMLFGDKSALDDEINENFRVSGLVHVLAVSGLHVGLIIGLVMAVLKACRIRRKYQFPIVLCLLLFYCYLCDWRFSILRASIMFLVLLGNKIYLRGNDLLSSICAAGILTLILFPYALWSVSFQLSYACMLGIALFMRPTEALLKKATIKNAPRWVDTIQNFFIKGTAMYWTTTVSTLPLIIAYFGKVPIFGIVTNLLFLPLMILAFQAVVIALVTWVCFGLLVPINYILDFVRWGTRSIANIPLAEIHVQTGTVWILFYFAAMFLVSRFIFLPKKYKYTAAALFTCIYMIGFLV